MDPLYLVIAAVGIPVLMVAAALVVKARRQADAVPIPSHEPQSEDSSKEEQDQGQAEAVGAFYDATTDDFEKVYGEVIQAFRTHDLSNLLNHQMQVMEMEAGMNVVDAGCGVGGPACFFAEAGKVNVQAVTISEVQVGKAREKVKERGLEERVQVLHGDYHRLDQLITPQSADVVYFLESFGHSHDKAAAIDAAARVLKPGGKLYIKDLFLREPLRDEHIPLMQREVDRINTAYHYHIGDLYEVLRHLRQTGWILSRLQTIDLPLEDFENLSISNEFQELTGIGRIDSWHDYIFPVEFYEIVCYRPWFSDGVGDNRYFLQNLYYAQVHGKSEAEIAEMKMDPEALRQQKEE